MGALFKKKILKMIEKNIENDKDFMAQLKNADNKSFVIELLQQASFLIKNSNQIIGRDTEIEKVFFLKNN